MLNPVKPIFEERIMKLKQLLTVIKRRWYVSVIGILIFLFVFFQFGQDVKVNSTTRFSYGNESEEYLVVTANKLFIINKKQFAQEMLQRRIEDSFKEVMFMGNYSDKIEMEVYLNEWTWEANKRAFLIVYERDDSGEYKFDIQ